MPKKQSKRYKKALELVEPGKRYSVAEAADLVGKFPKAKFDESIELAFKMSIDPRKTDQMIRGTVRLPNGSGKEVKVLVFTKEAEAIAAAKAAGAEFVGFDEFIEKVTSGWTGFDVAIATPEAMGEVRKLGRVLGPRGLMPQSQARHCGRMTPARLSRKSRLAGWSTSSTRGPTFRFLPERLPLSRNRLFKTL